MIVYHLDRREDEPFTIHILTLLLHCFLDLLLSSLVELVDREVLATFSTFCHVFFVVRNLVNVIVIYENVHLGGYTLTIREVILEWIQGFRFELLALCKTRLGLSHEELVLVVLLIVHYEYFVIVIILVFDFEGFAHLGRVFKLIHDFV